MGTVGYAGPELWRIGEQVMSTSHERRVSGPRDLVRGAWPDRARTTAVEDVRRYVDW